MADDDPTPPAPATGTPPPEPPKDPDRLPDDHPVVKALKKANEEAAAARLRIKEFEDKDKSEGEKLTGKITEAEKRAEAAEARALRLEVAAAKGLTPAQAKRLVGTTQEELEADADEILETFPTGAKQPPSTKPSPSARGGTDPTEETVETDPAKLAAMVPRL